MSVESDKLNENFNDTSGKTQNHSIEQVEAFVQKYDIPVDKTIVLISRSYFSLQTTIIASVLWMPFDNIARAVVFLLCCVTLDAIRMFFLKPVRALVLNPDALLVPTKVTLDARTRREGKVASLLFLAFALLPLAVIILPDNYSTALNKVVYHLPFISNFGNIQYYQFSTPENAKNSFDFLALLQLLSLYYLLYLVVASVRRWEYHSTFSSKFFSEQANKPKDIGQVLSLSVAVLLCFVIFYRFLSPHVPDATNPSHDWLGPLAMWMYGITEFGVLFIFQSISKALLLSTQVSVLVSKNRNQ